MRPIRPSRLLIGRDRARAGLRKSVFLLPSLLTVGNMFCGFAAIMFALQGNFWRAGWLIFIAGVLDGLDGRLARLTHTTSDFGKEYDSLADVVSFGLSPAILIYLWGLKGLGRWGWAVAFLFLVAGSVRLARFNIKASDRRYFTGLPIPMAAGAVFFLPLLHPEPIVDKTILVLALVASWIILISCLMISTFPYNSFKELNLKQRLPATAGLLLIAVIVAVIYLFKEHGMAVILGVYLVTGPLISLLRVIRRRGSKPIPGSTPVEAIHAPPTSTDHS